MVAIVNRGRVFRLTTTLGPILGLVLIALPVALGLDSPLRDVLFVLSGVLISLVALRLTPPEQGTAALRERDQHDAAYYLGYAIANLRLLPSPIDDYIKLVDYGSAELRLRFSDDEQAFLSSVPSKPSPEHLVALVDLLVARSRQDLPASLWPFLQFGAVVTSLYEQMERWGSTRPGLTELEALQAEEPLRLDGRYASVVDELVKILRATGAFVTPEQRPKVQEKLLTAFERIPRDILRARSITVPLPVTDWYWVTEGAMRFIGDDYSVLARSADSYEITDKTGATELTIGVERDQAGWHCALHPEADERHPCPELDLVLNVTDRGRPVTEARLILVRSDPEGALHEPEHADG
jgi:hypothetical protein